MSRLKVKNKTNDCGENTGVTAQHMTTGCVPLHPRKVEPHFGLFDSLHYCYLFSEARVVVCAVLSRPPHTDSRQWGWAADRETDLLSSVSVVTIYHSRWIFGENVQDNVYLVGKTNKQTNETKTQTCNCSSTGSRTVKVAAYWSCCLEKFSPRPIQHLKPLISLAVFECCKNCCPGANHSRTAPLQCDEIYCGSD